MLTSIVPMFYGKLDLKCKKRHHAELGVGRTDMKVLIAGYFVYTFFLVRNITSPDVGACACYGATLSLLFSVSNSQDSDSTFLSKFECCQEKTWC